MNISLDRLDEGQGVSRTLLIHKAGPVTWSLLMINFKEHKREHWMGQYNQMHRKQGVLTHQHKNQNASFVVSCNWMGRCTEQVLKALIAIKHKC